MANYSANIDYATYAKEIAPVKARRIIWGAIFGGVAIALVVHMTLSLLGLGIGFGAIDPMAERDIMQGLGTGALIWWVVTTLVALFVGGWMSARLAASPKPWASAFHGLVTWAVYAILSFYLLTTTVGGIISGVGGLMGQTLTIASEGIAAVDPQTAAELRQEAEALGQTIEEERQRLAEQQEAIERTARETAAEVSAVASRVAIFAAIGLILGGVVAGIGGWLGRAKSIAYKEVKNPL
jgi:hypothetical protein